jgi:hypothetical protein
MSHTGCELLNCCAPDSFSHIRVPEALGYGHPHW